MSYVVDIIHKTRCNEMVLFLIIYCAYVGGVGEWVLLDPNTGLSTTAWTWMLYIHALCNQFLFPKMLIIIHLTSNTHRHFVNYWILSVEIIFFPHAAWFQRLIVFGTCARMRSGRNYILQNNETNTERL